MYLSTPRGTARSYPLGDSSLGSQGLFGSQGRPGMRSRKRLGSLSGSSLGDDTPVTPDIFPDVATMAATAATIKSKQNDTYKKVAIVGGLALVAYLLFARKSAAAAPAPALPAVP